MRTQTANGAFAAAASEFHVPQSLLEALCYMEGRLSNHGGSPSADNGFGCMNLVKNSQADTLDQAAKDLGVSTSLLRQDLATNIRGGAAVLRDTALQLSTNHTLPASLADWYTPIAVYSHATVQSTATMYANAVYTILRQGFRAQTDTGETVTLAPQAVTPNRAAAERPSTSASIPGGCTNDANVDYPGAVDCIVPQSFACTTSSTSCSYGSANRPTDYSIDKIVIHDTEGSLQDALNIFQNPNNGLNNGVSVQYVIDTDGTVYQLLHEHDIAYHAGNYWYNEHSIGIEHVGYDAQGYQWYNAAQYLASAKLVAYLLKKYNLPLDRTHIVAHGTIPSDSASSNNHVDPGPYWLWDYYFGLIHQQGIAFPTANLPSNTITLHPQSDQQPDGPNGTETTANFNFFSLYTSPSTRSSLIANLGNDSSGMVDVSDNVEPGMTYSFVAKAADAAGTGDTMYEIWYGEEDRAQNTQPSYFADAHLAWLDVPAGDGVEGNGTNASTPFVLHPQNGGTPQIYGRPTSNSRYIIGGAPVGAMFTISQTYVEDGTSTRWYEINYNHRQAWAPASEFAPASFKVTYTSMAPNADGCLEAFARGTDNLIWHTYQHTPNGVWRGWTLMPSGETFNGDPVVGVNANGMLEVFARGSNNNIWTSWQNVVSNSTTWAAWVPLPSPTPSQFQGTPSVVQNSDGHLEIVARRSDGTIWHNYQKAPNGSWSGWSAVQVAGPRFNGDPVIGANADGHLEVFARGIDNTIYHTWEATNNVSTSWTNWAVLQPGSTYQFQGTPTIAMNPNGHLEVVARFSDGTIWHNYQVAPNGGWYGWSVMQTSGQTFHGDPILSANADGHLEIFAVGSDNKLYHMWETLNGSTVTWSSWGLLQAGSTNQFQGTPAVAPDAGGRLIVNAVGPVGNSTIWTNYQMAASTGPWGGWVLLTPNAQFQP